MTKLLCCVCAGMVVSAGSQSLGDSSAMSGRASDDPSVRPCVLISNGKVQFDMVFTGASFLDDDRLRGLVTFRVQSPPR